VYRSSFSKFVAATLQADQAVPEAWQLSEGSPVLPNEQISLATHEAGVALLAQLATDALGPATNRQTDAMVGSTLCVFVVSWALAPAAEAFFTGLRPPPVQHQGALYRATQSALSHAGARRRFGAGASPTAFQRAIISLNQAPDQAPRSSEAEPSGGDGPILQQPMNSFNYLAFDATGIDDKLWLALLTLVWPILVAISVALATARTLGVVLVSSNVVVQRLHHPQSVPTVYLPPMQVPFRLEGTRGRTRSSTAVSALPPGSTHPFFSASSSRPGSIDWVLVSAQVRLQTAIDNEDYAAARIIKAEIDASQRRQTNELAEQLLQRCSKMKQRQDEEKQKMHDRPLDVPQLQALIASAVAEDDYTTAANLQKQLQDMLCPSGSLAPIAAHRADLSLLESDVKRRANEMFIEYAAQRRDPVANLTAILDELIEDENFEEATQVHAELMELQRERDRRELMKMLRDGVIKQRIMQVVREQNTAEIVRRAIEIQSQNTHKTTSTEGGDLTTWADFFEIKTWENP